MTRLFVEAFIEDTKFDYLKEVLKYMVSDVWTLKQIIKISFFWRLIFEIKILKEILRSN